jgi:LysM repeat protein
MQYLRQLGGGVIIAIFSVILVVGGIFLSLAETLPPPATPTQIPPTFPQSFPTPTFTITPFQQIETPTVTSTETASPSPTILSLATTSLPPVSCAPPSGWIRITTGISDTIYSIAERYKTSAENLSTANCLTSFELPAGFTLYVPPVPTVRANPCGPPAGWVRAYIVQPGDNLYRIALSYGLTYSQLQRANCMGGSTTIYAGQRLWVPNIPPRTPIVGTTVVPTFPTDTSLPPTVAPTDTQLPPATDTSVPPATQIPAATDTPPSPPPSQ